MDCVFYPHSYPFRDALIPLGVLLVQSYNINIPILEIPLHGHSPSLEKTGIVYHLRRKKLSTAQQPTRY